MMIESSRHNVVGDDFALKPYLAKRRQMIDQALQRFFADSPFRETRLVAAMQYSINAGGKRLRPILCLASAHAVGGRENDALPAGCALEMIHTYSLIHDDLPAMDDDDLRRGKPTCHKAFNEATAILAGDALLTGAFQMLARHALHQDRRQQATWIRTMALVAEAAGHEGMIEGQMQDMASEGRALSRTQLEALHSLKTGALITAAVTSGAAIGGADEKAMTALETYGRCIGLAFQVTDDILNETGDPHIMGKAVGTDQLRQKSTYPAVMGLEEARRMASDLVTEALRSLAIFDSKSDPLRAIARYIIERQR